MPLVRLAAVIVFVLLVAGCGDDGTEQGATGTAAPAATETATPAATATPRATPAPAETPTPEDCGQVGFTPQTDHGAFEITATGTDCQTARAVAAAAENESSPFTAEGFRCTGELDEDAVLPSTQWTCESGDARVTFETS